MSTNMQFAKKWRALFLLFLITCFTIINTSAAVTDITDYQPTFFPLYDKQGKLYIAIRKYFVSTDLFFLAVDPYSLETRRLAADEFKTRKILANGETKNIYSTKQEIENTPYMQAVLRYTSPPYKVAGHGIQHAEHNKKGVFLSIDLCPSSKPFEEKFFKYLVNMADKTQHPTPIAIAITGLWISGHKEEFRWLQAQQAAKKLDITWVNHSFSHRYYADVPFEKNFMLLEESDFMNEVLSTEKLLLMHGEIPSVFFRFPGLVADKNLLLQTRKLGLISLSTDAWLAKGEKIKEGSIILVHGNSNEPEGIELVMEWLAKIPYPLLPLNQVVLDEVSTSQTE